MSSNVYMTCQQKTSTDDIISLIINDKWTEEVFTNIIINPRGGDKYIFYKEASETRGYKENLDWKADGFNWNNTGKTTLPHKSEDKLVTCLYYQARHNKKTNPENKGSFSKKCYFPISRPYPTFIEYFGDHFGFEPSPHGNAKKRDDAFQRHLPSVMAHHKEKLKNDIPMVVNMNLKLNDKPRNRKNLKNIRKVIIVMK